jgi:aminoglycoside 6-adenylyltransferase
MNYDHDVIHTLVELGNRYEEIRAVVLTSTRANPDAPVDLFSDYDPILYVTDLPRFTEKDDWFEALGPVLVVFRWINPDEEPPSYTRLVMYESGDRIDYSIRPLEQLKAACAAPTLPYFLDVGYEVLLDKDGLTAGLKPPTYQAHIPAKPTEAEYATLINDFWWDSIYVPKHLWRGDLMPAKYMLETDLRHCHLQKMLEWSVEIEKDWQWQPGIFGKGLKKALDPETYQELVDTYTGGDTEEVWRALYHVCALFRKVSLKVGEALGYPYPHELDRKVSAYHKAVQALGRQTVSREEWAKRLGEGYRKEAR